jgi:glucose-1-phosphate adenylyltransferase
MVLAGGAGERLRPLTEIRAKAAVPFGGMCRLIDFVLSNLHNSGIREIFVLTQYQASSLHRHLAKVWSLNPEADGSEITPIPPPRVGGGVYLGTADAIYRNLEVVRAREPEWVLVFGADHVYTMDVRPMIRFHVERRADVTVSAIPAPLSQAARFGTIQAGPDGRVEAFLEKNSNPPVLPGRPGAVLASMGNYVFNRTALLEILEENARDPKGGHDFGRDILPKILETRRVFAYDFETNIIPGADRPFPYWRDVGTIESFFQANLELNGPESLMILDQDRWPLRAIPGSFLPPRISPDADGRSGQVENAIMAAGSVVAAAHVRNALLGPNVHVSRGAWIEDAVLLGDTFVGEGARIRKAVIDVGNEIGPGEAIGFDSERDARAYHVDPSGIVVVPHGSLADTQRRLS